MKITLNTQQLNNLKSFLQRVQLQGSEVGAYIEILRTLENPTEDKIFDKDKEKELKDK